MPDWPRGYRPATCTRPASLPLRSDRARRSRGIRARHFTIWPQELAKAWAHAARRHDLNDTGRLAVALFAELGFEKPENDFFPDLGRTAMVRRELHHGRSGLFAIVKLPRDVSLDADRNVSWRSDRIDPFKPIRTTRWWEH